MYRPRPGYEHPRPTRVGRELVYGDDAAPGYRGIPADGLAVGGRRQPVLGPARPAVRAVRLQVCAPLRLARRGRGQGGWQSCARRDVHEAHIGL
jgi:hypothetical protein